MSVLRKGDGGQPWAEQHEGLPQTHADDLVFRHSLALARDRLIMVTASTTGNGWMSHNGAESMQLSISHLPPVAALAFLS